MKEGGDRASQGPGIEVLANGRDYKETRSLSFCKLNNRNVMGRGWVLGQMQRVSARYAGVGGLASQRMALIEAGFIPPWVDAAVGDSYWMPKSDSTLGLDSSTARRLWQAAQSWVMLVPFFEACSPSCPRKQPEKLMCPMW